MIYQTHSRTETHRARRDFHFFLTLVSRAVPKLRVMAGYGNSCAEARVRASSSFLFYLTCLGRHDDAHLQGTFFSGLTLEGRKRIGFGRRAHLCYQFSSSLEPISRYVCWRTFLMAYEYEVPQVRTSSKSGMAAANGRENLECIFRLVLEESERRSL